MRVYDFDVQPLGGRLIVEPVEPERDSPIMMPDSMKGKDGYVPAVGKVVSKGPGHYLEGGDLVPLPVDIGDYVYYPRGQGFNFKHGNKEYIILSIAELMCSLKPKS